MTTLEAIRKHRNTATRIARGFYKKLPKSVPLEDIEQAALIGLWRWKADHPDESAPGWIGGMRIRVRGSIVDELRAQDWLARRARGSGNGAVIVRFDDIQQADDRAWEPSSEDPSVIDRMIVAEEAAEALRAPLRDRDRKVVDMVVWREMRFQDVAHRLGISEPRVSQLHARSMRTMRAHLTGDLPEATPSQLMNGTAIPREARKAIREHHANQANRTADRASPSNPRRHPPDPHPERVRAGRLGSAAAEDAARPVPSGSGVYPVGTGAWSERLACGVEGGAPVIATLPEEGIDMGAELERYRVWMLDQALIIADGNKAKAARLLRINRTTLVEMLRRHQPAPVSAREESPPMKQTTEETGDGYQRINSKGLQVVPRVEIARLRGEGLSITAIAARLQCNRFLVERELRRQQTLAKCGAQ
jgi:RNA polymerase sigma factor for flagellar operon FliA